MTRILAFTVGCFLISCQQETEWVFKNKINLPENIRPLGIDMADDGLWISDPDNNRILKVDENGDLQQEISQLHRPMHIEVLDNKLFIPNFFNDTVSIYEQGNITTLAVDVVLDAPSAVSVLGEVIAIADFYNHRVLLLKNGAVSQIGKEGREDGLLYYPTDVELFEDKVIVADAYNNRVQIFDQKGNFQRVIGWKDNIRVATGLEVFENKIYVTDYYGNRILVYDFEGLLLKTFEGQFNKPTDILVQSNRFYVANYGENTISVYEPEDK